MVVSWCFERLSFKLGSLRSSWEEVSCSSPESDIKWPFFCLGIQRSWLFLSKWNFQVHSSMVEALCQLCQGPFVKLRLNQHLCNAETYSLFHINLSPLSVDARWLALPRNHWGFPTKNPPLTQRMWTVRSPTLRHFFSFSQGNSDPLIPFPKRFIFSWVVGLFFAMGIQFHLDASTWFSTGCLALSEPILISKCFQKRCQAKQQSKNGQPKKTSWSLPLFMYVVIRWYVDKMYNASNHMISFIYTHVIIHTHAIIFLIIYMCIHAIYEKFWCLHIYI